MTKITKFSHNSKTYQLEYGGWLNHRYSKGLEALSEVHTDDIVLKNITIGDYKAAKRTEYAGLKNRKNVTYMKYLKTEFKKEFGMGFEETIKTLKQSINNSCISYLLRQNPGATVNERSIALFRAASNGHVASTYFIATSLSDKKDDSCLHWLTLAHNRGHIGAAYDIAAYLYQTGNILDALRCLIISADGGCNIAYMTLFSIDLLKSILMINECTRLNSMLDELIDGSHNSCARYFKAILLLIEGAFTEGITLMNKFRQAPKKKPSDKDIDDVYATQLAFTEEFLDAVIEDILSHKAPLVSLMDNSLKFSTPQARGKNKPSSLSFNDYQDSIEIMKTV